MESELTPQMEKDMKVSEEAINLIASGASHRCVACGIEHPGCCGSCEKYPELLEELLGVVRQSQDEAFQALAARDKSDGRLPDEAREKVADYADYQRRGQNDTLANSITWLESRLATDSTFWQAQDEEAIRDILAVLVRPIIVHSEKKLIRDTLDALGLALTNHKHVWTSRERKLYEEAQRLLRPQVGDPDYSSGHSINADGSCNMGCC